MWKYHCQSLTNTIFLFFRAELERQRKLHAMEVQSVEEARYRLRAQLGNVYVEHFFVYQTAVVYAKPLMERSELERDNSEERKKRGRLTCRLKNLFFGGLT